MAFALRASRSLARQVISNHGRALAVRGYSSAAMANVSHYPPAIRQLWANDAKEIPFVPDQNEVLDFNAGDKKELDPLAVDYIDAARRLKKFLILMAKVEVPLDGDSKKIDQFYDTMVASKNELDILDTKDHVLEMLEEHADEAKEDEATLRDAVLALQEDLDAHFDLPSSEGETTLAAIDAVEAQIGTEVLVSDAANVAKVKQVLVQLEKEKGNSGLSIEEGGWEPAFKDRIAYMMQLTKQAGDDHLKMAQEKLKNLMGANLVGDFQNRIKFDGTKIDLMEEYVPKGLTLKQLCAAQYELNGMNKNGKAV
eukprot:CAMPEP_0197858260 /NCGR_PEP_ID=MMETSP1438-20131217/31941_1 /TAXON_ID=1461541 /ORGANISM="Pterosperma sp., Strain CCMP1384" /LENGTH=310 /DNA_ID=CAMNT_0043474365 /DNA_START=64 /DNA_END=996 /DNA_ORIENTATION=+